MDIWIVLADDVALLAEEGDGAGDPVPGARPPAVDLHLEQDEVELDALRPRVRQRRREEALVRVDEFLRDSEDTHAILESLRP